MSIEYFQKKKNVFALKRYERFSLPVIRHTVNWEIERMSYDTHILGIWS